MNSFVSALVTIVTAVIGVAIVATLVSRNAQTPQVIQSGGNALAEILGAATAPVSGGSSLGNYGSSGLYLGF